ncbi:hypothetical protein [Halostella litorea]|uniref:hypothetical protein n=1 Tax=Halostella litorea TaxID=2528831 RepID=UPI001091B862|nr:hypothetical protein [Halostella litorea]
MASDNDADRRAKDEVTDVDAEKADVTEGGRLDRRSYLKLTGSAAAAALGTAAAAGSAAAQTSVNGISFDRTVDIVEDHGADNTGSQSIDSELESAMGENTLITFPEGTYKVTQRHELPGGTNVGFLGEGEVRFVPSQGSNFRMFNSSTNSPADQVLFKNIDFDIRADNTVTGLRFNTRNGVHVENVEYVGRGIHPDGEVTNALTVTISNPDATGTVKNLVAKKGSTWARYKNGDGRVGIGVYQPHVGTLKVIDCHLAEFGNNGMYTSRHNGKVQVEGGVFRNNNVAGVRIGGQGSYVDGASFEIDPETYTGPRESGYESNAYSMRAVRIEQRKFDKPAGAEVRNCDIVVRDHPAPNEPIEVKDNAKSVIVRNTRIEQDVDGVASIGSESNGHPIKMDGVSLTGNAGGGAAVSAPDSPNTVVQNCCIQQTGDGRDGVKLNNSDGSVVQDSNINVPGEAVNVSNSSVDTANITKGDTCPAPSLDGGSGNPSEGSWGSDLANTVTVESTGSERATYEFSVSEALEAGLQANVTNAEYADAVEGTTGTGSVAQYGSDNYRFDGEVTDFTVDGPADVFVNGEQLDLSQFGSADSGTSDSGSDTSDSGSTDSGSTEDTSGSDDGSTTPDLSRTVRVTSTGSERATYEIGVSEAIEAGDGANVSDAEYLDAVEGTTASGSVAQHGSDDYAFAGDVTSLSVDGPADVYVDGEQVDPANVGSDDGSDDVDPSRTLRVASTGSERATYEISVGEALEPGENANLTGAEYPDVVEGTTASGSVAQHGTDDYAFAGDVTALSVDGPADVYVDGEQVDPANFGDADGSDAADYPNQVVIDGREVDATSDYTFSVSGELAKDPDAGSVNANDVVSEGTATGQVNGGIDGYRFSGDVTSFRITGSAAVEFESEE